MNKMNNKEKKKKNNTKIKTQTFTSLVTAPYKQSLQSHRNHLRLPGMVQRISAREYPVADY